MRNHNPYVSLLFDAGAGFTMALNAIDAAKSFQRNSGEQNLAISSKALYRSYAVIGALVTLLWREGDIKSLVTYGAGFVAGLFVGNLLNTPAASASTNDHSSSPTP